MVVVTSQTDVAEEQALLLPTALLRCQSHVELHTDLVDAHIYIFAKVRRWLARYT